MSKASPIKKFRNGEIADADEVNQVVESAGSEGGLLPYDPTDHEYSEDGSQSLGSTAYPWGSFKVNQEAELVEVDATSHTVSNSVAFKNLRKFIYLKDAPNTFVGQANKFLRCKVDESGLEFAAPVSSNLFTSSGSLTIPDGITEVYLTMIGGGGGGGYAVSSGVGGGGGGAGQCVINHRMTVTPGNTYTITIGAGGSAGNDGGSTSFGSFSVSGGNKGGNGSTGGTGGSAITPNASGSTGGLCSVASGSGGNATGSIGGGGGGSVFGSGANGGGSSAGANTGCGGGGGTYGVSGGSGGSGGSGLCLVMY